MCSTIEEKELDGVVYRVLGNLKRDLQEGHEARPAVVDLLKMQELSTYSSNAANEHIKEKHIPSRDLVNWYP